MLLLLRDYLLKENPFPFKRKKERINGYHWLKITDSAIFVFQEKINLSNLGFWDKYHIWRKFSNKHNSVPFNFQNNNTSYGALQILLSQSNQRVYGAL